ncbi:MAG TPA: sigma 54-interacting transcriptional regulator [Terriglobales bacterium]|nr:sigma 54-interacting transcriptional regulator [Terriglobales bacterium]
MRESLGVDGAAVAAAEITPIFRCPEKWRALLEVSRIIATHKNLSELLHNLAGQLHGLLDFGYLSVVLHDPARNVMRLHTLESSVPKLQPGAEFAMDASSSAWVWEQQQPLIVGNTEQYPRFRESMQRFLSHGVRSMCSVPLTSARRRLGALNFGACQVDAYSPAELEIPLLVAGQVATAIDNALNYEDARALQQQVARERDRFRLLLEVNNSVVSNLEFEELFGAISGTLRRVMQCDSVNVSLPDAEHNDFQVYMVDSPDGKGMMREQLRIPMTGSGLGRVLDTGKPLTLSEPLPGWLDPRARRVFASEGFKAMCFLPLVIRGRVQGILQLNRRTLTPFTNDDLEFLAPIASQIAIAVGNALEHRRIKEAQERLSEESSYLRQEIRVEHDFEEIIGGSSGLRAVLKQVETVAPTDSTVLIIGETGTGKELVARAIHDLSTRREHILAKLNCAAIPTGLLESELFGHEKGAFTGAIAQKVGRFELADKGTLFLDEVGDIPPELQPKLLRVLQEKEFERLGSTRTQRVDIRLIAATNRDLAQMVADKQFRSDLYYRLNIFPISVPPLRDRAEDIPMLVRHFVAKYARETNKKIDTIPEQAMEAMTRYSWPGNIRELQNFIERAVILSPGNTLRAALGELDRPAAAPANSSTLEQTERSHILKILQDTNWVVGGRNGAAKRLGLKRTTLIYKMEKLGITRLAN